MSREDRYTDDYGIGDANDECSSGRSCGTPATRPSKIFWRCQIYENPHLYGTENIKGKKKSNKSRVRKSRWRQRKDIRLQNKLDLENGKTTSSVQMMKKHGITGKRLKYKKYEGRGTIEDEWVQRTYKKDNNGNISTAFCLMSKRGPYKYSYVPPQEPVKKRKKNIDE